MKSQGKEEEEEWGQVGGKKETTRN